MISKVTALLYILSAVYQYSNIKFLLLVTVYLFDYSHPSGSEMISYCAFELHQLMTNDAEHLFMCVLTICLSFLEKYQFRSFVHSLIGCLFIVDL